MLPLVEIKKISTGAEIFDALVLESSKLTQLAVFYMVENQFSLVRLKRPCCY